MRRGALLSSDDGDMGHLNEGYLNKNFGISDDNIFKVVEDSPLEDDVQKYRQQFSALIERIREKEKQIKEEQS